MVTRIASAASSELLGELVRGGKDDANEEVDSSTESVGDVEKVAQSAFAPAGLGGVNKVGEPSVSMGSRPSEDGENGNGEKDMVEGVGGR